MRKVTTAEDVREALRNAAKVREDGLYTRIENEIKRMKEQEETVGSLWLSRRTPQWLIDEAAKTYRDAGFAVAVEDVPPEGRALPDDGGFRMILRVK